MTKRYRRNSKKPLYAAYSLAGLNAAYAAKGFHKNLVNIRTAPGLWLQAFLLMVLLMGSLGWYVLGISARVGEDYRLQKLEKRIDALNEEHNNLTVRLSQEKTLDKIEERALTLGLVPAAKASYVVLPSSTVASVVGLDTVTR